MASLGRLFNRSRATKSEASPLTRYVDRRQLYPPSRVRRLGSAYGGWTIPADHGLTSASVCYLAGAGEDISFDCELVRLFNCKVRIIDPTPRAIDHFGNLERSVKEGWSFAINHSPTAFYELSARDLGCMRFLPIGLSDRDAELSFYLPRNPAHVSCSTVNLQKTSDYFVAQCFRLASIMAQQGDASIDLLKMDIEGAEYSVIMDLVATGLLPRLLLIEFDEAHTPMDGDAQRRIGDHMALLAEAGMKCIAVDGCNASFVRS